MKLLLHVSAGLIVWAAGFSLLYALHGLGCESGWHQRPFMGGTLFRWIMLSTWVALCLATLAIAHRSLRLPPGFTRKVTVGTAFAALAAMAVTGAPVALTSACL